MNDKPSQKVLEDVLLILYHRNGFYRESSWELGSALRVLSIGDGEAFVGTVAEEFLKRGWATFGHIRRDEAVLRPSQLTPEGTKAAIRILQERHFKGPFDRLHRINWITWGGVAALVSASFAAIAAYPVLKQFFK